MYSRVREELSLAGSLLPTLFALTVLGGTTTHLPCSFDLLFCFHGDGSYEASDGQCTRIEGCCPRGETVGRDGSETVFESTRAGGFLL